MRKRDSNFSDLTNMSIYDTCTSSINNALVLKIGTNSKQLLATIILYRYTTTVVHIFVCAYLFCDSFLPKYFCVQLLVLVAQF